MRYLSARDLRAVFNRLGLADVVQAGQLTVRIAEEHHPSPPGAFEPVCTRSQALRYCDASGQVVAVVHQYTREDGTIGASGRPDPKVVYLPEEILTLERPNRRGREVGPRR